MPDTLATIAELFLYPVKSMAGVASGEAHVGLDGISGDRLYSFVNAERASKSVFPWMTAREAARMLLYQPEFVQAPTREQPEPAVLVRTPEGGRRDVGDAALCEQVGNEGGRPVFLLRSARGIFDCQHISLFSLSSVRGLAEEAGCVVDRRRFRANIYLEPASGQAFEEEAWTGYLLQIGAEALIAVTQRDARCMMVNLDPETGEQNPKVLKTIAQAHQGQAGIYANVVKPGVIRVGDPVRLVSKL